MTILLRLTTVARAAAVAGVLALVAGCAESPPSRFYTLAPVAAADAASDAPAASRAPLLIGVGPVTLPEYLDRPQIVRRSGDYVVELAEFDKWAEPLESSLPRVLGENLSSLLANSDVVILPRRLLPNLDYRVEVVVGRFDVAEGAGAVLSARWEVTDKTDAVVDSGRSTWREPLPTPDFEGQAAAMSGVVAKLSRDIADAVRAAPR